MRPALHLRAEADVRLLVGHDLDRLLRAAVAAAVGMSAAI